MSQRRASRRSLALTHTLDDGNSTHPPIRSDRSNVHARGCHTVNHCRDRTSGRHEPEKNHQDFSHDRLTPAPGPTYNPSPLRGWRCLAALSPLHVSGLVETRATGPYNGPARVVGAVELESERSFSRLFDIVDERKRNAGGACPGGPWQHGRKGTLMSLRFEKPKLRWKHRMLMASRQLTQRPGPVGNRWT